MREFHSSQLLSEPPKPIEWLVDGILPMGTMGDVSGPPGDGKSTIMLSMAEHISTGSRWFGHYVKQMPVAWISGEASGPDAIARDLWRLKAGKESDILFILPEEEMFRFNKKEGKWLTTEEGIAIFQRVHNADIGLMVIDTVGSVCAGLEEINNDQTRQLVRHIKKELGGIVGITISHTNQSSSHGELDWRLHYLSRAGGNGFPGAIRWASGVSKLQGQDADKLRDRVTKEEISSSKLVAFGISKHNEMPRPENCNNDAPMIFEICKSGELVLISDGKALQQYKKEAANGKEFTRGKKKNGAI